MIPTADEDSIELGDLIERLETSDFDGRDEEGFASWAPELRKLANNRSFLADLVIDELKDHCRSQLRGNQYGPQVVMLYNRSKRFMLRANFWPAVTDSVIQSSGPEHFFYGLAHDHNFSFLTVGYLGPGYWSEYYEYDYGAVLGVPGEAVPLRFVEKAKLDEGKVMLYRAHQDIHLQLPADAMSVSLNILEGSHSIMFRDQYEFDVRGGFVKRIITSLALEQLLALSAHFGGDKGRELIDTFAAGHPSDRVRAQAVRAQASAFASVDDRIAHYERAARTGNPFVSAIAAREVERIEANRDWIERPRTAAA
ncbi:hypothetical protein [Allosphingosinicella indica]|uniref:hypothetical protein n=1 Tax=Allosphingosinicella indica TaxID=941907 RepID=UPI000A14D897|nr:hypothetical protein [Allosphingosinicella indica]